MILCETIKIDTETNMRSYVYKSEHASRSNAPYAACLEDMDSEQVVDGSVRYYPTVEQAAAKASEYIK